MPKTKAISLDFVDGHKAISRNSKTVTEYRTTLAEVGNKTSKTRKKSSERCD